MEASGFFYTENEFLVKGSSIDLADRIGKFPTHRLRLVRRIYRRGYYVESLSELHFGLKASYERLRDDYFWNGSIGLGDNVSRSGLRTRYGGELREQHYTLAETEAILKEPEANDNLAAAWARLTQS